MVGDAVLVSEGAQTRSKRFLEIQKLRESKKEYDVPTAISLMKQMASAKFKESAEAHFRMNLDPKYNDQQLRATVLLFFSVFRSVRLRPVAFADFDSVSLLVRTGEFAQGNRPVGEDCGPRTRWVVTDRLQASHKAAYGASANWIAV